MRIKLGIKTSLREIAKALGGRLITNENAKISHVTTDTRELESGDLFIALSGERFDGENYVSEAKARRAYTLSKSQEKADIFHPDTRRALLNFAEYYCKNLPIILYRIGITGSVGKTTTKEFLQILLSRRYKCHYSKGNFNNEIGMPMSLLSAPPDTEVIIMEMGMNHPGEIKNLSLCLKPNIALITNIGTAHIGNLGSRESIAKAKLEIAEGLCRGPLIVPFNEPLLHDAKNRKTFSSSSGEADYYLTDKGDGYVSIFKDKKLCCKTTFSLDGEHHKLCLIAAASAAMEVGISPGELANRVRLISTDNTRQNVICLENYHFYADFYNASFESVMALIKVAESKKTERKISLVLGDILELGDMSEKIHLSIGEAISPLTFHNVFLYGKYCDIIRLGAINNQFPSERIFTNNDISNPGITADQIRDKCDEGEIIFMKASRGIRLENILNCFRAKGECDE